MPLLKKEELLEVAAELGVDLKGLTWPEQQKAVNAALKALEPEPEPEPAPEPEQEPEPAPEPGPLFEKPRNRVLDAVPDQDIIISGEIQSTRQQLIKYDEPLDEELEVEEVSYMDEVGSGRLTQDLTTGTYRVKGKTGRRVTAQSTLPKQNAKITYNPRRDVVPVISWKGKRGYLWNHATLPSIKPLLQSTGFYYDYKDQFDAGLHPENIWYATGLLAVNIPLVHAIMNDIEAKAKREEHKHTYSGRW